MRYLAVVIDYDGVVASDGRPSGAAISALQRLKASGRRAILISGRRLDDLVANCPQLGIFDCVVAENGAVVYMPGTRKEYLLASPPPIEFVQRLKQLGVHPLEVGWVIISSWIPHQTTILQVIQELGLELQIIFNRAAVLVLPAGVNKGTGMSYALRKLGLSRHEVVAVGDSENDHSYLEISECPATVANAVPSIRRVAAMITKGKNGEGLSWTRLTICYQPIGHILIGRCRIAWEKRCWSLFIQIISHRRC